VTDLRWIGLILILFAWVTVGMLYQIYVLLKTLVKQAERDAERRRDREFRRELRQGKS
jgi:Na+-translocating ferredoxin:NAD+ oxidoreductase RnfG subunit